MERRIRVERKTAETSIMLHLNLDGKGKADIQTGIPFLEHMLTLWCRHGFFDLQIRAKGDIDVDCHHLTEDLGICLGRAWNKALGDKKGIRRYGFSAVPMDEALVTSVVDLSGRPWLHYQFSLPPGNVGSMDTEHFREFWQAFVNEGRFNLHLIMNHGHNKHHIIEASFKSAGRAMNEAVSHIDGFSEVLTTKGRLE